LQNFYISIKQIMLQTFRILYLIAESHFIEKLFLITQFHCLNPHWLELKFQTKTFTIATEMIKFSLMMESRTTIKLGVKKITVHQNLTILLNIDVNQIKRNGNLKKTYIRTAIMHKKVAFFSLVKGRWWMYLTSQLQVQLTIRHFTEGSHIYQIIIPKYWYSNIHLSIIHINYFSSKMLTMVELYF
jgi:hypothetical protein